MRRGRGERCGLVQHLSACAAGEVHGSLKASLLGLGPIPLIALGLVGGFLVLRPLAR
jgi:hypothetical protein